MINRRFIKGVGSGYLSILIVNLVALFLTPFSLKYLSRDEFAIFTIANDILIWLSLVQLGTGPTLNAKIAQFLGKNDTQNASEFASTSIVIQLLASAAFLLIGYIISINFSSWFDSSIDKKQLIGVFRILVFSTSISMASQVFSAILVASKQVHIDNYISIVLVLLRTVLTVILLITGMKLYALAFSSLAAVSITGIIAVIRVRKSLPDIRISFRLYSKNIVREIITTGIWFTLGGVAGILLINLDSFLVGKFISLAIVTSLILNQKLYQIADKFVSAFLNTTRPYFGQMMGKNDLKLVYSYYSHSVTGTIFLNVIIATAIFLANKHFLRLWVGPDFYLGHTFGFLLALNFILQTSLLPNRIILALSFYKIRMHAILRLLEGILKLILGIILLQILDIKGILLASIIASLVFSTWFMNYYSYLYFRKYKIKVDRKLYLAYFSILMLVLTYFLRIVIENHFIVLALTLLVLVCVSLYFWKYIINDDLKKLMKKNYDTISRKKVQI